MCFMTLQTPSFAFQGPGPASTTQTCLFVLEVFLVCACFPSHALACGENAHVFMVPQTPTDMNRLSQKVGHSCFCIICSLEDLVPSFHGSFSFCLVELAVVEHLVHLTQEDSFEGSKELGS